MNMKATRKIKWIPSRSSPGLHLYVYWCVGWPHSSRSYQRTKSWFTDFCWYEPLPLKEMKAEHSWQLWSNPDVISLCPFETTTPKEEEEEIDHKDQSRKEDVCWAERRIPSRYSRRTFIWNQTVHSAHRHSLQNSTDTYRLFLRTKGCSHFLALKETQAKTSEDGRNGPQLLDQCGTKSRCKKQGPRPGQCRCSISLGYQTSSSLGF